MDHPAKDARGVLDQFASAKLGIGGSKKNRIADEFLDPHFKRNARARGRLGKDQRPGLTGKRLRRSRRASLFIILGKAKNYPDPIRLETLDAEKMFHGRGPDIFLSCRA